MNRATASLLVVVATCVAVTGTPSHLDALQASRTEGQVFVDGPDRNGNDDGPRLQRAIDAVASTGGVVHIRSGLYRLDIRDGTRALAPRRNVRIVGEGAGQTILRVHAAHQGYAGVFYPEKESDDLSGFALRDLTIDQDGAANHFGAPGDASRDLRVILAVFVGSNLRVEHSRFTGLAGRNSLVFNGTRVTDVWIANNQFDNVGDHKPPHYDHSTIYVHGSRAHVLDNSFVGRVAEGGAFGATTAIETHGSDHIVSGNVINGYLKGMNVTGVAERSDNIVVSGNTISGAAIGIQLWSNFYGSNRSRPALTNLVVSENTIAIDRDRWRAVAGADQVAMGIGLDANSDAPIERIRVERNAISFKPTGCSGTSDDQSGGIEFWTTTTAPMAKSLTITENQITDPYSTGIRVALASESVLIAQNIVRNAGSARGAYPDAFRSGVLVSHLQRNLAILANQFSDDRPTPAMKYGIYDASATGSSTLRAVDNQLYAAAGAIPMFETAGSGSFFVAFVSSGPPALPTRPVAAGSTITDTSDGRVRVQIAAPAGTRWRSHAYRSEAPTTGEWTVGDIVYDIAPSPGGSLGWVCVVSGAPGVFKAFGVVAP